LGGGLNGVAYIFNDDFSIVLVNVSDFGILIYFIKGLFEFNV